MEIDPTTGLPMEAIEWEDIAKKSQRIKITKDKRKFGKIITIVSGFDRGINVKDIAKSLKNELACGGTSKDNVIELQGDHAKKVKPILVKLGFDQNSIED